jgi:hypothetical protein
MKLTTNEAPESARINAAVAHANAAVLAHRITGTPYSDRERSRDYMTFLAGYDDAMERGYPELLAENRSLQDERMNLEAGQHRIIELENLANEVAMEVTFHTKGCECNFCKAYRAFGEAT